MVKEKIKLEDIKLKNYLEDEEVIKTNLIPLDIILNGGIRNGEFIQLVGSEGKTSIALQIALSFCRQNKKIIYIDAKGDVTQKRLINMNLNDYIGKTFFYIRETSFEVLEDILDKFISTNEIDLIIVDDIASLINPGYLNIENGKKIKIDNQNSNYGTRPLALFINKYKALSIKYKFSFLLVNQMRNKIHKKLGSIEKIFGPKVLANETNVIIKIVHSTFLNFKDIGNLGLGLEFRIEKSNRLRKGIKVPFFLEFGRGCSNSYALVCVLIENKIINQDGAYYEFCALNIRVKGMIKLFEEINRNSKFILDTYRPKVDEYYNSLIDVVIDEEADKTDED